MLVSIENVKRRFTEIICVNFEGKHKGDTICINDMAWDTTSGSRIGPQSSVPELSSINIPMMTMKRLTIGRMTILLSAMLHLQIGGSKTVCRLLWTSYYIVCYIV